MDGTSGSAGSLSIAICNKMRTLFPLVQLRLTECKEDKVSPHRPSSSPCSMAMLISGAEV